MHEFGNIAQVVLTLSCLQNGGSIPFWTCCWSSRWLVPSAPHKNRGYQGKCSSDNTPIQSAPFAQQKHTHHIYSTALTSIHTAWSWIYRQTPWMWEAVQLAVWCETEFKDPQSPLEDWIDYNINVAICQEYYEILYILEWCE